MQSNETESSLNPGSLSRMLAALRYELMTPITSIVGFSELLLDSRQGLEQRLQNIQTIIRNSHYLLSVMDAVIQLAQTESVCATLELEEVSFEHLVKVVRGKVQTQVRSDQQVEMQFDAPLPKIITTDLRTLRDIILNMILAALRLHEKKNIVVSWQVENSIDLIVRVRFWGPVPTQKQIDKAVELFGRTDGQVNMRYRAIALEMSLINYLVKVMNGRFEVQTLENFQSELSIRIPGCIDAAGPVHTDPEPLEKSDGSFSTGQLGRLKGEVLLADDNADNLALVSAYLGQMGLKVTTVSSGRELVERFKQGQFDLLVTDVEMPDMGGLEAVSRIRREDSETPILAITANSMESTRKRCLDAGCTEFLTKPIVTAELEHIVACYVKQGESSSDDSEPLHSAVLDDEPDMKDIIYKFIARLPNTLTEVNAAAEEGNWDTVRRHIHQLKGLGTAMGYMDITELCAKLEFQIMGENLPGARLLVGELNSLGARVVAAMVDNKEFEQWKSDNGY